MDIRNAIFANPEGTAIDLEIDHPEFGWIPFTASPDDPEAAGRAIFDQAAAGAVAAYAPPPDPPPVVPDRVSARQFKMQLEIAGLLDQVEAWVAAQPRLVQIAYANSATFLRGEPMMQAGFAALGFSAGQIDQFYIAAAAL